MKSEFSIKNALIYTIDSLFSHPGYFLKLFLLWLGLLGASVVVPVLLGVMVFPFALIFPLTGLIGMILGLLFFGWLSAVVWYFPAQMMLNFYDQGARSLSIS